MALRDVAIVGLHATEQARRLPHRTSLDLAQESVLGAIADAGLCPADVDGVAADWAGPGGIPDESASWSQTLGRPLAWVGEGMLDTAGARGVMKAAAAISAGLCEIAVVGGGLAGKFGGGRGPVGAAVDPIEFVDEWGAYSIPLFALVANGYLQRYGTSPRQLAAVAATIRNNGAINPEAMMYGKGPYTIDDILASPLVATPFHLLEVCITGEGGGAVVLTTVERARDLPHRPVTILGAAMEFAGNHGAAPLDYQSVGHLGAAAVRRAFGLAQITPHDVDVFELYDPNAFELMRQLEILGLCNVGEGGAFVEDGNIRLDGPYPTNPEGGCLSHAWNGTQHMTLKVAEAVRQLRGSAVNQINAPEVAVVANAGSGTRHFEMLVLGRS